MTRADQRERRNRGMSSACSNLMDPYCKTILRELNGSLHRIEIVPYDVLGKRAEAAVASIDRLLSEEADLHVDG